MTTITIKSEEDRERAILILKSHRIPCTVNLTKGVNRSVEQNRLQRMWINEASEQLGEDSPEAIRAFCKLHFGVPILRNENDHFREQYDRIIRPHSYEDKLAMMSEPLSFPVTRLMTTNQKTRYLDEIYGHFTERGVKLTEPDERKRAA